MPELAGIRPLSLILMMAHSRVYLVNERCGLSPTTSAKGTAPLSAAREVGLFFTHLCKVASRYRLNMPSRLLVSNNLVNRPLVELDGDSPIDWVAAKQVKRDGYIRIQLLREPLRVDNEPQ